MTATDTATPFLLGVAFLVLVLVLAANLTVLVLVLRIREQIRSGVTVHPTSAARRATPVVDR